MKTCAPDSSCLFRIHFAYVRVFLPCHYEMLFSVLCNRCFKCSRVESNARERQSWLFADHDTQTELNARERVCARDLVLKRRVVNTPRLHSQRGLVTLAPRVCTLCTESRAFGSGTSWLLLSHRMTSLFTKVSYLKLDTWRQRETTIFAK
ncbi:LAME_0D03796g1_1 [Lachancea meyersii CBS 8951]|uniref:LAME_0D03796g1_1 n=1 Tax=Lachancea meyersii CBS 8951 TaxID=1266667 RepID=A0A1G4J7Q2_9SACH|nr:LAME_0D03796g1_1 [Lachancea meyersii CBS 8951]